MAIAISNSSFLSTDHENEFASLKILTEAETPGEDIQQTELRIVKGIREIFEADVAMIMLFDEEAQDLVIKKTLTADEEWGQPYSQKMEPGLIADVIEKGSLIALSDVAVRKDFNPIMDGVLGIETRSYLCSPLVCNNVPFGALALVNPLAKMLTADRIELFQILTTALANAIYNARMFMQLKVSNADLEAMRYELLNSRDTLRALFDNLPTSIYIIDRNYSIVAINMSRVNRVGERPNQLVGRKCYEKLHHRTSPCHDCQAMLTMQDGRSTNRILREQPESGETIEWEISTFPIYNKNGQLTQTIITEFDVTEKRMLEADLVQSEKMAAIGQLAAGVAHEIFNPLTAIIANTQMINRTLPEVNEDVYESLGLIEHAGVRASQVIRTLLSAARKEEGENAAIDLNITIENALSLLGHEIMKRPVTIKKDLQAGMPSIYSNPNHLQGVWINLVMNALDALDPKGGTVTITSRYSDNKFRVVVSDNGMGIPKNKLNRIFEPYFTTKAVGHGTGLGLSVSLRVVKQHGGNIQVESQPEKGTVFTVTLPHVSEDDERQREVIRR